MQTNINSVLNIFACKDTLPVCSYIGKLPEVQPAISLFHFLQNVEDGCCFSPLSLLPSEFRPTTATQSVHCYAFIATFRVVSEGKGSPQRYALPVSWKQSMPCQEHACVLVAPGTGCPDPAGAKARGRRWLLPGRVWLSLGVAGCQKISICQQGQGCQASVNRVQFHHLQAEGNPQEDTQVPQAGSIHLLPSVLVAQWLWWLDKTSFFQVIHEKSLMLLQLKLFLLLN